MAKIGAAWSACPLFAIEQARRPRLLPFVERIVSAQLALPNMMEEDADHPALSRLSFVEEIRRNALDRILQVQKLRFSVGGSRTFGASKLVHRRAADLTVDDLGIVLHRELEGHPTGVVTYYSAPLERHRKSPTPGLTKMRPFAGLVERVGRLPKVTQGFRCKIHAAL